MTYRDVSRLRYRWYASAPEHYQLNRWGDTREGIFDLTIRREVANGRFYLLLNRCRINDRWFDSETEAIQWGIEAGKKAQQETWAKNDPGALVRAKENLGRKVLKWS